MPNPIIRATFRKYHNIDQVITQFEEIIERQNNTWAAACGVCMVLSFFLGWFIGS